MFPASPQAISSGRHLPYRVAGVSVYGFLNRSGRLWDQRGVLWDAENDGTVDLLCLTNTRELTLRLDAAAPRVQVWQEPLPPAFSGEDCVVSVEGVWAFADPKRPEVVIKTSTPDRSRWRFERRRVDDGTLVAAFELAGGEDRRPDGTWDGNFTVLGVEIVATGADSVQALILAATAGYDQQPRGVLAVAMDGTVIWRYPVGPQPYADTAELIDLDGDGSREILFAGRAVGNLDGQTFHGTSDDTARVFVLDLAGQLRWSHPGGAHPGNAFIVTVDGDGDGRREVVVASQSHRDTDSSLRLVDADGRLLDTLPCGDLLVDFARVGTTAEGEDVVLMLQDGTVTIVHVTATGFAWGDAVAFPPHSHLVGVADCLPEVGPEILVRGHDESAWILSSKLEPLAHDTDNAVWLDYGGVFTVADGTGRLAVIAPRVAGDMGRLFYLEPNPRPVPWGPIAGALGASGLVAALVIRRKTRPSRGTVRELRLQLLERLMLSGHGAIGGLSTLRRFLWNLDAVAQGYTLTDERRRDLLKLADDIRETRLPGLEAAVELARLSEVDADIAGSAARALGELRQRLQRMDARGLAAADPTAIADLQAAGAAAEQAFQALRRAVESSFRAEPAAIVAQSLAAHHHTLTEHGIAVTAVTDGWPACCIDPEELAFVLDNLVENAVRALAGSPDPRLEIAGETAGRFFVIRVRDTGYGIAPDDWERIFEVGASAREGGGVGLPRSRRVLRKYGGKVAVVASEPGGGTTMALTVQLVRGDREDS